MGRRPRVTHEEVLEAARDAFAGRGYDGTTLADIGTRLGISPAAILRHAPSKQALFAEAMRPPMLPAGELPIEFLKDVPGDADPVPVLRRVAEAHIPFIERRLGADLACYQYAPDAPPDRKITAMRKRSFGLISGYMRRAARAGRLEISDPEAAALAFMGSLVSYVFIHKVARILDPPLPLPRYLDNLLTIWTRGAVRPRKRKA
jgi:AcrR family transcriptional regulator